MARFLSPSLRRHPVISCPLNFMSCQFPRLSKSITNAASFSSQPTRQFGLSASSSSEFRPPPSQMLKLTDIGSRPLFNSDHDIFRQAARKFFDAEVKPYHAQWEKDGQVSREVWLKAGEQGLLGVNTPAEHGGIGGDWLDATIVLEEQAYSTCSGPGFAIHSDIVMPYISHYGTPEQIQRYIPGLTDGTKIGAIAMTEPGAGSDLQGIRTTAVKDGDDYILNGSKVFITNGYMCDVVIVVAITNPSAKSPAHGISLFLVEEGMPGFRKGKKLNKMGMKAQDTAELFFEDVRLPKSALLGKENGGFYQLMQELPQERLLLGISSMAASEWAFEETREYLLNRKAFGKTLSNLQTIQHRLAAMKTELVVNRAFTDQCIELHNQGKLDGAMASMCKYWITDLQNRITYEGVQLHGGWGYMWEYPICRAYVDAKVQTIYGGSNEIMRELIARSIVSKK
ncbi:long-chain specific acyl-CoA dehydrogenase, mitochondrial-like [Amphibalanus amphitrite]|uniref:long-chain specific acyl-CoA dehydrogenase, mitochondrial-like n=1 Tax=Amphibalanus amphitrite TaxID=1232801 RepID=UPI001C919040|nr:long-chain specific acyl-CoA dehydrogenase, mitochondrial-like [Amphibalanus amphitrite]